MTDMIITYLMTAVLLGIFVWMMWPAGWNPWGRKVRVYVYPQKEQKDYRQFAMHIRIPRKGISREAILRKAYDAISREERRYPDEPRILPDGQWTPTAFQNLMDVKVRKDAHLSEHMQMSAVTIMLINTVLKPDRVTSIAIERKES